MSHPYKGIPRKDWPKKDQPMSNALSAPVPDYLPPQEVETPAPKVNSEAEPTPIIRNLFSGQMMKLSVVGRNGSATDPIPGWRLYWIHDVGNNGTRVAQARMSGYEHVTKDEISLFDNLVPGNNDLGSQVRQVANPSAVPPTYCYLMKKPMELHEQHQAEMQTVNDRIENAIRRGKLGAKPEDRRYVPGEIPGSSLPEIKISSNNYR